MSILLMTAAFKLQISATRKFVLLALCDAANDQGECYPSVTNIMEKCSAGERTVQAAIAYLEREQFLRREFRTGRSTVYWITDPRNWRTPAAAALQQFSHPTPAVLAPLPPQQPHPTPAAAAPRTVIEPSVEPSVNQKKQRGQAALPCPDGVTIQVWADWLALRKAKRAPVTQTAIEGAQDEARKAGLTLEAFLRIWCRRGTQGLEAAWIKPDERKQAAAASEPAWRTEQRERNAAFAGRFAVKPKATPFVEMEIADAPRLLD